MKKFIIITIIAGLLNGVASAKELTTSEKDAAITGGVIGGAILVTSPWWGAALYNKNKYGTWIKPGINGKLFKSGTFTGFNNINNDELFNKLSNNKKNIERIVVKYNNLGIDQYKSQEYQDIIAKQQELISRINRSKYSNGISWYDRSDGSSVAEDEAILSSKIKDFEANKGAIVQEAQNKANQIKSQELEKDEENASISEVNDPQSNNQQLVENEEIASSSDLNLENVAENNAEENEAVKRSDDSDNYTDKADRGDGEILDDLDF